MFNRPTCFFFTILFAPWHVGCSSCLKVIIKSCLKGLDDKREKSYFTFFCKKIPYWLTVHSACMSNPHIVFDWTKLNCIFPVKQVRCCCWHYSDLGRFNLQHPVNIKCEETFFLPIYLQKWKLWYLLSASTFRGTAFACEISVHC